MRRKIGLIIQGPLVSKGISGRVAHIVQRRKLKESEIVNYDCRKNIQEIIDKLGHLFESVVVSTWEDEVRSTDSWRGATLVTTKSVGLIGESVGGILPNNKFKQIFGILSGIKYLKEHSNVDFIIKIRTDQWVDIPKILESIEHYFASGQYTQEVIFVPRMKKDGFGDFYFAGNIKTLESFHEAFFEFDKFEFHPSVHREMWLKYAYVKYRNYIKVQEHGYFPKLYKYNGKYCKHTLAISKFMIKNVFRPLSFDCYRTIIWRGEKMTKEGLRNIQEKEIFEEEFLKRQTMSDFFPKCRACSLAVDWQRYEEFRRKVLGKPASTRNWARQQLTVFLRPFWYVDRIAYYVKHPSQFLTGSKRILFGV